MYDRLSMPSEVIFMLDIWSSHNGSRDDEWVRNRKLLAPSSLQKIYYHIEDKGCLFFRKLISIAVQRRCRLSVAGLNPGEGKDVCLLCLLCCIAASATRQSLFQRSPTGSTCMCVCLIVCEIGTSTMKRPRPEFGCCVTKGEVIVPEHRCTSTRLYDVTSRKTVISICPAHCHIRPALSLSTLLSDWSNLFFHRA